MVEIMHATLEAKQFMDQSSLVYALVGECAMFHLADKNRHRL